MNSNAQLTMDNGQWAMGNGENSETKLAQLFTGVSLLDNFPIFFFHFFLVTTLQII